MKSLTPRKSTPCRDIWVTSPDMEIKVILLKIAFDGLISEPDTAEERISKPEKQPAEALKIGTQREKARNKVAE